MAINTTAINGMGAIASDLTTTGMGAEDIMHISEDFLNQAGIINSGDLQVSQNSPVGMSVLVGAGKAYIQNSSYTANSLTQTKFWRFVNNADVVVPITSNSTAFSRITSIFARVDTAVTPNADASNVIIIEAVDGISDGSLVIPATPNNAIRLANITVVSGATTITTSRISNQQPLVQLEAKKDGWIKASGTWTYHFYASSLRTADINVPRTAGIYSLGMKIKFTQATGGVKYGIIVRMTSTRIHVFMGKDSLGNDYVLVNETIIDPAYSTDRVPLGFDIDPLKWTISISSSDTKTQSSPTQNAWYFFSGLTLVIPSGSWDISFSATGFVTSSSASDLQMSLTLSSLSTGDTDSDMTTTMQSNSLTNLRQTMTKTKTYYSSNSSAEVFLLCRTTKSGMSAIGIDGAIGNIVIKAICNYL